MRWNATYRYKNADTLNEWVDGSICQVDNSGMNQLRDAEWGKEKVLVFDVFFRNSHDTTLSAGDTVEVTMNDGETFVATIVGIDFTDRRVYALRIESSTSIVKTNGSVAFKIKSGGGINPITGFPTAATVSWRTAADCHYVKNNENLQEKEQGEPIVQVNYTIYIAGNTTPSEQLRLYDSGGNLLGEFSVISTEYIETKGVTQITV